MQYNITFGLLIKILKILAKVGIFLREKKGEKRSHSFFTVLRKLWQCICFCNNLVVLPQMQESSVYGAI